MNVVVSISCLLQERYLHFDSLFSCFGIATARTSFVSITKTGSKTKVRTCLQRDEVMKSKVFIVSHRYCHGYSRSQFVAKYLNTSSIKINPHPLSAAAHPGHFRQFYARTRSRAERGESGRAWEERGAEAKEIGCRSISAQSESDPRQDKTWQLCALSKFLTMVSTLQSPTVSPTNVSLFPFSLSVTRLLWEHPLPNT